MKTKKTIELTMDVLYFQVRPYAKCELAAMYFPASPNDAAAVANLRNLIKRNPELQEALRKASYRTYDKSFTAEQVRILVRYIGEP